MTSASGLNDIRAALAAGKLDPQAAVTMCWDKARAREPDLEAFAFLPEEPPPAGSGPLAGIGVGIKDLIDTHDMPTTYGSPVYAGHRPEADAAIVAQLRGLGASLIGKTVSTEFAWLRPGPTRNPWNRAHTPGGSSSGSAAAVAAGTVPLAVGTQTFGSVIRPAAFCGIIGFKPTIGILSREGIHPLSGSLDHVGLFARTVGDIAFAFRLLAPTPRDNPADPAAADLAGTRLAILAPPTNLASLAQIAAFAAARDAFRAGGADLSVITLPTAFEGAQRVAEILLAYEAARIFAPVMERSGPAISPVLRQLIGKGQAIETARYEAARAEQDSLRSAFAALSPAFDALLTIPAAGEAPEGLGSTGDARFCVPWSLLGTPAITIPAGFGPAGLPLGLQIVGTAGADAKLLAIAEASAKLLPPWHFPM